MKGEIKFKTSVKHRYLDSVPAEVRVTLGGTDSQRIFVMNVHRTDEQEGTCVVVDHTGRVHFATPDFANMVGYPAKKLPTMKLEQLLPQPFAAMHHKWLREERGAHAAPMTSCRAGAIVQLQNESGGMVPVKLKISSAEDKHVAQVFRATPEAVFDEKRVVLTVGYDGLVSVCLMASRRGLLGGRQSFILSQLLALPQHQLHG